IGATVAALSYRVQVDALELEERKAKIAQRGLIAQLERTREAETRGRVRLFESLVSQAQARRLSRRMGQRLETLAALQQAATIARELKLQSEQFPPLRDEAIAALALPDMQQTGRVIQRPPDVLANAFDSTLTHYALRFRNGTIQVRRVADDAQIGNFEARGDR